MIDARFIAELEGYSTRGYVPDPENSESGVTVGMGVDLAHANIHRMTLPQELKDKLVPYKGLKGKKALKFLEKKPLLLTPQEAVMLSKVATVRYTTFVKNFWNADSDVDWSAVPDAIQTIAFSVLYQYGRPARVPKFWKAITALDVAEGVAELRDFGDRYPTRRNKEADYLLESLDMKGTYYA